MDLNALIPVGIFILCLGGAAALIALAVMLVNTNKLIKDMHVKVNPLMDRTTLTIDAVNLEIMRVDQIMEDVNVITKNLSQTTGSVDSVVSAPANVVSSLTGKLRGAINGRDTGNERVNQVLTSVDAGLGNLDEKLEARKVAAEEKQAVAAADAEVRSAKQEQANKTSSNIKDAIAAHVGTDSGAATR